MQSVTPEYGRLLCCNHHVVIGPPFSTAGSANNYQLVDSS